MPASPRPQIDRRQEGNTRPVPASQAELVAALERLRDEAVIIGEQALLGIEHHSYRPYWKFRAKLQEHAALIAIIRSHAQQMTAFQGGEARVANQRAEGEEREMCIFCIKASLRFGFALSANPMLPLGSRETFVHELEMLTEAGRVLAAAPPDSLPEGILDDLATARMILEEIIEKSPPLADFGAQSGTA
jgi:hypothetical protein